MTTHLLARLVTGAAGLTALGVGIAILSDPTGFYAGYGIEIAANPDLLSELRAPGANLAALGAMIALGALRAAWTRRAAGLGAVVFLAFAFGRLASLALDGAPSEALTTALVIELIIGGLCLAAARPSPSINAASRARAQRC